MKTLIVFISITFFSFLTHSNLAHSNVVSNTVDIDGKTYDADWYLPEVNPVGFVLLQHGFGADSSSLKDMAMVLMQQNIMVLTISSSVIKGNPELAAAIADAIVSAQLEAPNNHPLPEPLVLAGHSAGGLHVAAIGKRLVEAGYDRLAGLVLFDPVDDNNLLSESFSTISTTGVPVYAILANAGLCNSQNNARPALAAIANQTFVGFKLTHQSAHLDANGSNTSWFQRLLCGTPSDSNIETVQAFTAAWTMDLLTGSQAAAFYPGGSSMETLLDTDRAALIKE